MELYRLAHPGDTVASAGTVVDAPGQTLHDALARKTIAVMQELGVDVSGNTRTQLAPEMLDGYDKVIVMSEPEHTPDWLRNHPGTVIWTIQDTKYTDLDGTRGVRDELQDRIASL